MKNFNEALAKQASMPKCDQFLKELNTARKLFIILQFLNVLKRSTVFAWTGSSTKTSENII